MSGTGGYVLVVVIWTVIVVAIALAIETAMSSVDHRRRHLERNHEQSFRRRSAIIWRIASPPVWIVIICALASVTTLFAVAERTATAAERMYPWLG